MKLSKVSLCAAVALGAMAMANVAAAEDAAPAAAPAFTFNVGVASDYVFRGVKQTIDVTGGAATEVFGGVDWSGPANVYAGVWLSNTGFSHANGIETDFYGGWKPKAGPVTFDLGLIYYTYNNSSDGFVTNDANTLEGKLAASIAAGPATLGAAVYYSNDWISSSEGSTYWELNGSIPLRKDIVLSGAVDEFQSKAFKKCTASFCSFDATKDNYTTWNVGVTVPITDKVSIDARYIDTNKSAKTLYGPLAADNMFVGTLKATF